MSNVSAECLEWRGNEIETTKCDNDLVNLCDGWVRRNLQDKVETTKQEGETIEKAIGMTNKEQYCKEHIKIVENRRKTSKIG
jgi:hypothetical protein